MASASETIPSPTHQRIYDALRSMLLFGELPPGRDVTLLGLAAQLDVSITPIRESVRRLIAEGALQLHGNRRISVPRMDSKRLEEIYDTRLLLEPKLALRAMKSDVVKLADQLERIDEDLDTAIDNGDVTGYLKLNHRFHFEIYNAGDSVVILPIIESLWLQVGPFLRVVSGRYGTSSLADHHKAAIAALRQEDDVALEAAIRNDIAQGLDLLRVEAGD